MIIRLTKASLSKMEPKILTDALKGMSLRIAAAEALLETSEKQGKPATDLQKQLDFLESLLKTQTNPGAVGLRSQVNALRCRLETLVDGRPMPASAALPAAVAAPLRPSSPLPASTALPAAVAAPLRLSGPLLKYSPHFLRGWQLRWFEVGGGSVRYYGSPAEAKAHAKPKREVSLAGLSVQMKNDSAFAFTALCTGDRTFSLDATFSNIGSYMRQAGWDLGPAGLPTAQQWVAALKQEAASSNHNAT